MVSRIIAAARRVAKDYENDVESYPKEKQKLLDSLCACVAEYNGSMTPQLKKIYELTGTVRKAQLAKVLGISPQGVNYVHQSGKIPASWLVTLSDKFDKPISWFAEKIEDQEETL